jgi:hypothetical protein
MPETYQWLLVPEQVTPQAQVSWQAIRLSSGDGLATRASKRLRSDELLVTVLGSTILRKHLDGVPLWRENDVAVRELVDHFARYLYLPRLAGPEVLLQAVRDGVALLTWRADTFAYAESHDATAGRYRGLRGGQMISITADDTGLLVKSDLARRQLETETQETPPAGGSGSKPGGKTLEGSGNSSVSGTSATGGAITPPPAATMPRRYHGAVQLDPARVGRDASRIAEEVIAHLVGQVGADVRVTLEIEATLPNGAADQLVRTVTENSRTLKFTSQGFEKE